MKNFKKIFFIAGIGLMLYSLNYSSSNAAIIRVASTSYSDVNAAVLSANTCDTVIVPAGASTWSSGLTITKAITLQGAGVGSTVITGSNGITIISITPSDYSDVTNLYRVTGFTFDLDNSSVGMKIGTYYKDFTTNAPSLPKVRVDHNKFQDSNVFSKQAIWNYCTMTGVVDNNTITDVYYPIRNDPSLAQTRSQHWYQYIFPNWDVGKDYTIIYEDNTFSGMYDGGSQFILADAQYAGRYVFRYNNILSSYPGQSVFDMHGYGNTDMYSSFGAEIYGNNITAPAGTLASMRGGKTMVFLNKTSTSYIGVNAYADGCPSDYINQQLAHDSYFWGNSSTLITRSLLSNIVAKTVAYCNNLSDIPKAGRDYFTETSSPGITSGTLTNIPGTCAIGQGYWATDQSTSDLTGMVGVNPATPISGTLYKCTSTNTWRAFYTPYTYPHPLRSGVEGTQLPGAPSNLITQ